MHYGRHYKAVLTVLKTGIHYGFSHTGIEINRFQDAAYYALKLVKFASPEAAIDVLKHINHDHANMEETKNVSLET